MPQQRKEKYAERKRILPDVEPNDRGYAHVSIPAQIYTYSPETQQNQVLPANKQKSAIFIAASIVVSVICLVVSVAAYRVLQQESSRLAQNITHIESDTGSGKNSSAPAHILPESAAVGIGATLSFAGLSIQAANSPAPPANADISAPAGMFYITVAFTIKNIDPVYRHAIATNDFLLIDAAGRQYSPAVAAIQSPLQSQTLAPGQIASGEIAFLAASGGTASQLFAIVYAPSIASGHPLLWNMPITAPQSVQPTPTQLLPMNDP